MDNVCQSITHAHHLQDDVWKAALALHTRTRQEHKAPHSLGVACRYQVAHANIVCLFWAIVVFPARRGKRSGACATNDSHCVAQQRAQRVGVAAVSLYDLNVVSTLQCGRGCATAGEGTYSVPTLRVVVRLGDVRHHRKMPVERCIPRLVLL